MRTILKVNKTNIEKGDCGNPEACAVALALKRHFKLSWVSVNVYQFEGYKGDVEYSGAFTKKLHNFIVNFDLNKQVTPNTFQLDYDIYDWN